MLECFGGSYGTLPRPPSGCRRRSREYGEKAGRIGRRTVAAAASAGRRGRYGKARVRRPEGNVPDRYECWRRERPDGPASRRRAEPGEPAPASLPPSPEHPSAPGSRPPTAVRLWMVRAASEGRGDTSERRRPKGKEGSAHRSAEAYEGLCRALPGSAGSGPRTPVHRLYTTGARPVHDRRTGRLRRARRPGKASPTSRAGTVARGEWGGGSPSPLVQFSGPTHALLMEASAGPRAQAHGRAHDHTPGARAARRGTPLYDDFFTRISADCRAPRDGWHVTPARTCPPPCAVVRTPHGIPGAYRASAPGARRAPVPVQRPAPAPQFATPAPDSPPCTPHIRLVRTSCTPRTLFAYALYTERMHLPPSTYPANPRTPLPEPRHRPHAAPSPATPAHPRQIPPRPPAAPGPRSRPVPRTVSPPPRHPRAPTCTAVPSAHAHSDGRQAPTTRSAQPRTGSRALRTDTNPAIPAGAP